LRVIVANYQIYALIKTLKYFDVAIVILAQCTVPIVATIFAWAMLREHVTWVHMVVLLSTFSGALVVILGSSSQEGSESSTGGAGPWEYSLLISNPIMTSFGLITMVKLKSVHYATVTSYINISMSLLMTLSTWISG